MMRRYNVLVVKRQARRIGLELHSARLYDVDDKVILMSNPSRNIGPIITLPHADSLNR